MRKFYNVRIIRSHNLGELQPKDTYSDGGINNEGLWYPAEKGKVFIPFASIMQVWAHSYAQLFPPRDILIVSAGIGFSDREPGLLEFYSAHSVLSALVPERLKLQHMDTGKAAVHDVLHKQYLKHSSVTPKELTYFVKSAHTLDA